eukprot:TRINITY_DN28865_c0_g2_i1.p1 TRINITY_DN28865_c0_g2~~TRINITY_DN28865_c0_g2_i1.p1  ORF type:complete len:198 (+),score=66.06 TRINITY_DN28865_c0_g2_i1:67-594(+)
MRLLAAALLALAAGAGAQRAEQWRCGVCKYFAGRLRHHLDTHEGVNRGASWNKYSKKRSAVDLLVKVEGALEKAAEDATADLLLDGRTPEPHVRREMRTWVERVVEDHEDDLARVMKREARAAEKSRGQPFDMSRWLCGTLVEVCPTPGDRPEIAVTAPERRSGEPSRTRDVYDL